MGGSNSIFSQQELEEYQELTYFTKKEILHVYKRFQQIYQSAFDSVNVQIDRKVPMEKILAIEELKCNPFGDRMCQVFTSDGSGNMTFEDFLDMMSVFSDSAPKSVKVEWAFRIYDFDNDDALNGKDLEQVIDRLTGGKDNDSQKLKREDIDMLISNIYQEADLDDDEKLSYAEFEHVLSKAPDFATSFRIRL